LSSCTTGGFSRRAHLHGGNTVRDDANSWPGLIIIDDTFTHMHGVATMGTLGVLNISELVCCQNTVPCNTFDASCYRVTVIRCGRLSSLICL
jgi:hypothetical protein